MAENRNPERGQARTASPEKTSLLNNLVLAGLRILLLLILGVGFFGGFRATLGVENVLPDSGASRIIALQGRWGGLLQPLSSHNTRSTLKIYENNIPLGPQTGFHKEIREQGQGLYSHWGRHVWFSASDNTDPATNGREYTVVYSLRLHPLALVFLASAYILLYLDHRRKNPATGPESWLWRRFRQPGQGEARTGPAWYWLLVGLVFMAGLAYRVYWTLYLEVPGWFPDSNYYVDPVLTNPCLPLSQEELAGPSLTMALGLIHLGHPIWFLVIQNLLWAASTLMLTLTIGGKLRLRFIALFMCFYLCFVEKNLQLEYALLSEHLARSLNLIFFSILLLKWGRPTKTNAVIFGLVTAAAIIAKPSALVLTAAYAVFLLSARWMDREMGLKHIAASALIFTTLVGVLLGGYGLLYQQRFGVFGLASSGGFKLFYHTGHLIHLESEQNKEIKTILKEFMPLYLEKYAARNNHYGFWLNRGQLTPELRRDFGDRSPYQVVRDHVRERYPPKEVFREINRIYLELALEGIRKNPGRYLEHVLRSLAWAVKTGWNGEYLTPRFQEHGPRAVAVQIENLSILQDKFSNYGHEPPQRMDLLGLIREGGPPYWGKTADLLGGFAWLLTRKMDEWGGILRWVLALSLITLPWQLFWLITRPALFSQALIITALAAAVVSYLILIGLWIVVDPPRLLTNVQDLAVLWFLLQVHLAWSLAGQYGLRRGPSSS